MIPAIGIIGFGNMGEALGLGLLKKHVVPTLHVLESQPAVQARLKKNPKIELHASLASLVKAVSIVVVAIKPQDIPALAAELRPLAAGKSVISLAAGLTTGFWTKELGTAHVVRFMPNLAAKVGKALVGVSPAAGCPAEFVEHALTIAGAVGTCAVIPEKLMAAITGLSGSGLAFVFHFVHALAMGGVREGFAYSAALQHALDTVDGAVSLLRATKDHPMELESRVCSPSGTTIEGVKVLEDGGLTSTVMEAVSAAALRAQELERS